MGNTDPSLIDELALRRAIEDALELDSRLPTAACAPPDKKFRQVCADIAAYEITHGYSEWLAIDDDKVHSECWNREDLEGLIEEAADLAKWIIENATPEQWEKIHQPSGRPYLTITLHDLDEALNVVRHDGRTSYSQRNLLRFPDYPAEYEIEKRIEYRKAHPPQTPVRIPDSPGYAMTGDVVGKRPPIKSQTRDEYLAEVPTSALNQVGAGRPPEPDDDSIELTIDF